MKPLVSVIMPCYNSARSLPWALASLVAQTCGDWECIFVDDGSTDDSVALARSLSGPRIRIFRFEANRGRGAARQFALEQVKGDYVCMLDTDDWIYPWRLQTELELLEAEPKAAIVSAGVAILDRFGDLAGVRGNVNGDKPRLFPPITRLRMPPFVFGPSMIRMKIAKRCKFDRRFPVAEDTDFLMQIILNHEYALLNRNLYVYTEHSTVTLEKILMASRTVGQMFKKYRERFPLQSRINSLGVFAKSMVYRGAFALNRSGWLVRRRSRPPTLKEVEEFQRVRTTVALKVEETFGTRVPVEGKL
jgi:glycosyltransferase involved in cell wall biosynthesis